MTSVSASAVFVVVGLTGIAFYLTPSIIASRRQTRGTLTVIAINVVAGWTIIGWVTAFGLALRRGNNPLEAKHFAVGLGVMAIAIAVYEFFNLLWLHIPAP